MAHEIRFGYALNKTLWAAVFKNDGGTFKVNVVGGDTWAVWNDANIATYAISLFEGGGGSGSGTYTGTFPVIAAGVYHVTIYEGAVAATDPPVGHGEMYWDATAEISNTSLDTLIDTVKADTAAILIDTDTMEADLKAYILSDVIGADSDTLETVSDQLDTVSQQAATVFNKYGPGE